MTCSKRAAGLARSCERASCSTPEGACHHQALRQLLDPGNGYCTVGGGGEGGGSGGGQVTRKTERGAGRPAVPLRRLLLLAGYAGTCYCTALDGMRGLLNTDIGFMVSGA